MNNRKPPYPPFGEHEKIELRDLDVVSQRMQQRAEERAKEAERRIYDRLDQMSLVDALSTTVNDCVTANAHLTYVLLRAAREGSGDATRVEKYVARSNVEILMAVVSLICEARGEPDWRDIK
jgi:hypothetical protein